MVIGSTVVSKTARSRSASSAPHDSSRTTPINPISSCSQCEHSQAQRLLAGGDEKLTSSSYGYWRADDLEEDEYDRRQEERELLLVVEQCVADAQAVRRQRAAVVPAAY